jgi:imidazolonepropionase-like amidohydrolase
MVLDSRGEMAGDFHNHITVQVLTGLVGLTVPSRIRGAAAYGAQVLGVDDRCVIARGVIAAGKVADLIAVEGNPLEDSTTVQRIRWVMKGGVVHRGESR